MLRLCKLLPLLVACGAPPLSAPEPLPPRLPPAAPAPAPAPTTEPGIRLDQEGWFPYAGINLADRRGTALDASVLLDAPAGKHGALTRHGDGFAFADGSKARFWGMSIRGEMNFPGQEQAEFIAELCAQLGFNLTSHSLPAELDAEHLERFDVLVAGLIARGVSVALDFEQVREERFVRELLGHRNPHTGKTYAEEPAVVLLSAPPELGESVRAAGFRGLVAGNDWTLARVSRSEQGPSVTAESGLIQNLALQRTGNAPLLGRWSNVHPLYRNDAPLMMAAYSGLQGTSALMDSLGSLPLSEHDQLHCKLEDGAEQKCEGGILALWPALSRLFHRHHVKESPVAGVPASMAYVAKAGAGDQSRNPAWEELFARYVKGTTATSVTGELVTDFGKGLFKLDTPRSQGVAGVTLGKKESVSNLSVSVNNAYATVIATSLDEKPLARSSRILISAVGNAANRGALLAANKNGWQEPGSAPVMLEPMIGSVELTGLTGDAANVSVHYLSPSGQRLGNVPIQTGPGNVRFEMKADYRTLHYEVVRSP